MPAQRPRASFEPIAPDFNLKELIESTQNFSYVDRISCDMIEQQGMDAFERLVTLHVIVGGKPLVIEGYDQLLDPWTFSPKWLRDNCGEKVENSRNLTSKDNLPLTISHYMNNMGLLTNQFFDKPGAYREKQRQRVYLKDIDCPSVWWDKLKSQIPNALAYLNESTGDMGGPGAVPESNAPGKRLGKGIARAGDLMSSLPQDMRAENLMCYIGHEGTYTPAHREMCASLGHNIMVEASNTVSDDGKAEKPGSSIWFMTESKDRHLVSEYWLSILGHDIEVENHFAQIVAWKKAPFSVYVVEQCPGDFILIPPLAPHQVWNRGTRTMKVAWNRTTVETLEMALNEALPRSRIVCRDEQYKNKAIIYYTLQKYASLLTLAQQQASRMASDLGHQMLYGSKSKIKQLIKDFKRLFALYRQILLSEMFNPEDRDPKSIEYLPFDSNVTCAYCRSNVFNRFLTCSTCKDQLGHNTEEGDPYDVCLDCYAMGRSCGCISGFKWVEQFKWKELTTKYDTWRNLIIALDGGQITQKTPVPLVEERRRYGKKTLAEVCKEQLKRRPWKDVRKGDEPEQDGSEEEIVVGDNGIVKRIVKKKSKTWQRNNHACHVCCKQHPKWKMASCTTCDKWWCFGTLFRGWDKMPIDIMEDPAWSCPHCLGICFAGSCRREGKMQPYEPKGTLLGHDTRKVADARSVEALVDFSISNLNWLKDDDPANRVGSGRFKRAQAEAQQSKEMSRDGDDDDDAPNDTQLEYTMTEDDAAIDPALNGTGESHAVRSRRTLGVSQNTAPQEDGDTVFARRLQEANSSLPPPVAMTAGMSMQGAPDGYAPLASAGYLAPAAHMYPNPNEDASYLYPDNGRGSESVEPGSEQLRPFKRSINDLYSNGDNEDIAMSKQPRPKKPRLAAAGFRSFDLAEEPTGASASKAKNEAQRQFEREKERKALDKAKAEGRFIMLQAALKGKKRIVKLRIPGSRLAQLVAQRAAMAALGSSNGKDADNPGDLEDADHEYLGDEGDEVLLKSDVAPKKTKDDLREERREKERTGIIVTGGAKKALIPVEKDESYGYRPRERLPNTKKAGAQSGIPEKSVRRIKRTSKATFDYEEVDIGSDDDARTSASPPGPMPVNGAPRDRRSLPTYLQNRYSDEDMPSELTAEPRARRRPTNTARMSTGSTAANQLLSETKAAAIATSDTIKHRPTAGKRPSMRPIQALVQASPGSEEGSELFKSPSTHTTGRGTKSVNTARRGRGRPANLGRGYVPSPKMTSMEEQNRLAKLQALQTVNTIDDSPQHGTPDHSESSSRLISMAEPQFISSAESSDSDSVDAIPARRGGPPIRA